MAATLGSQTDHLAFLRALAETPYRFDFYQTLRRLECVDPDAPRWGSARTPSQESVRFGQEADVSFAPASLASFTSSGEGVPPRLRVLLFGLLGPNGALPIHLTEFVRDRSRNHGDPTLARFLDLLHHRFITLFYRAWAQAQPHVSHDRARDDRFLAYTGAVIGLYGSALTQRDGLHRLAKPFHAGALVRQTRDAEGLRAILTSFFGVKTAIQEFVGHWMTLEPSQRTALSGSAVLGSGAVLGSRVWDRQHKFRIVFGPLTLNQYESFLPGGFRLTQLVDWVRFHVNLEFDWDVRLVLARREVPLLRLGAGRLGWTTWLGRRREARDAADLCLNPQEYRPGARIDDTAIQPELQRS
ncbi:MAG: type VI secretion system baseplate subunit TssG [Vicinamibacterales bacterium]